MDSRSFTLSIPSTVIADTIETLRKECDDGYDEHTNSSYTRGYRVALADVKCMLLDRPKSIKHLYTGNTDVDSKLIQSYCLGLNDAISVKVGEGVVDL